MIDMPMTMVEIGARAIAEQAWQTHNRRDGSLQPYRSAKAYADDRWGIYKKEARAMLTAIREPTAAMLDPGGNQPPYFDFHRRDDAKGIWQAMIDTALKESP